jgi:hypothetical protein
MFWPTSTAVTTSPVGLVYLQLKSIPIFYCAIPSTI